MARINGPYTLRLRDQEINFDNWSQCLRYMMFMYGISYALANKIRKMKSPYYPTHRRLRYLTGLTVTETYLGVKKDENSSN